MVDPAAKDNFVPVYIAHGRDQGWARQAFHDLNVLAIRPNAALSIAMDARDPLTHVTREIERQVPFFEGRVNKVRRQLGKGDLDVVTIREPPPSLRSTRQRTSPPVGRAWCAARVDCL
jgi:DNA sulfur modification protein DndB